MTTLQILGFVVAPVLTIIFGWSMVYLTRDRTEQPQPDLFGHRTITPGE